MKKRDHMESKKAVLVKFKRRLQKWDKKILSLAGFKEVQHSDMRNVWSTPIKDAEVYEEDGKLLYASELPFYGEYLKRLNLLLQEAKVYE